MIRFTLLFTAAICLQNLTSKSITYPNLHQMPVLFDGSRLPLVKPVQGNYLYMAETEVSNGQYCEFLNWIHANKPDLYAENLPDTQVWSKKYTHFEPMIYYYLRHPAYASFPIVGITRKQAERYCLWLHDRLSAQFKQMKIPVTAFVVRLPDETEWMQAARGGQSENAVYPWPSDGIRYGGKEKKHQGKIMMNCRTAMTSVVTNEPFESFLTTETYSYWPNAYGLYNMSGNVAEWVAEPGIAKGGSWRMPPYNCRIDARMQIAAADARAADIGFRYVIEVISIESKQNISPFTFSNAEFSKRFCYIPADTQNRHLKFMSMEVSNLWYRQFLAEHPEPGNKIDPSVWKKHFRYSYFEQYDQHSAFNNYPVVGITYDAAIAFCNWLNAKYRSNEKRKYSKLVFRLPDAAEWEWAARGGGRGPYPWSGPWTLNARGCYLANFAPNEEGLLFEENSGQLNWKQTGGIKSKLADGLLIPGPCTSYFPNDYGLFCMSGNVAEMLSERGVCKGGSWCSDEYGIMIESKEKYESPAAHIGFRVLAEVLEK